MSTSTQVYADSTAHTSYGTFEEFLPLVKEARRMEITLFLTGGDAFIFLTFNDPKHTHGFAATRKEQVTQVAEAFAARCLV